MARPPAKPRKASKRSVAPLIETTIDHLNDEGIGIARFAEGKIVEMWEIADFPGLMKQLGAISPLEGSEA